MTSIGTLLAFVMVCAGVLVLRYLEPKLHRPFKTPFVPYVPASGILVCLTMMFLKNFYFPQRREGTKGRKKLIADYFPSFLPHLFVFAPLREIINAIMR